MREDWRELRLGALKLSATIAVTVGLIALLLRHVEIREVAETLGTLSPAGFVFAIGSFLVYQWFRAVRTGLLLSIDADRRLTGTMCLHGAAHDLVLPAGTSEVAFVLLLRKLHGVTLHGGVAALLVGRLVDLGLFALLFVLLIIGFGSRLPPMLFGVMLVLLVLLSGAMMLLWIGLGSPAVGSGTSGGFLRGGRWRRLVRLHLHRFRNALREVHGRGIYGPLIVASAGMWFAMYFFYLGLTGSLRAGLGALDVLLLYVLVFPADLTPVKGVANFGTHEAAWFVALRILGWEAEPAAMLGFTSHVVTIVVLVICAALGLMWIARGGYSGASVTWKPAADRADIPAEGASRHPAKKAPGDRLHVRS